MLRIFENGVVPTLVEQNPERYAPREVSLEREVPGSWASAFRSFQLGFDPLVSGPRIYSTGEAFVSNVWVRAGVEAGPIALSHLPFVVYGRGGAEAGPIEDHPLTQLIAHSNPILGLGQSQLLLQTFLIRQLFGECFWLTPRSRPGKLPYEIWIYHPWAVEERIDYGTGELLAWRFLLPNGFLDVDPADVVHFPRYDPMRHNPYRPTRGTSVLVSAGLAIAQDISAQRYNAAFFDRGCAPDGVVRYPESVELQSAEEVREQIKLKLQKKSHEPLVLDRGGIFDATHASARDSEFILGRKMNREEIAAALKVPPFVIGIPDNADHANARHAMRNWWQMDLIPTINDFCTAINTKILGNSGYTCDLDIKGVVELREDFTERVDQAAKLHMQGLPWDVISDWLKLDLPEFPGHDKAYLPITMIELDTTGSIPANKNDVPAPNADVASGVKPPDGAPLEPSKPTPRLSLAGLERELRVRLAIAAAPEPFEYQSTQVNLPPDVADKIRALGQSIPDGALAEKGREDQPHVTVKYGLHPDVTIDQVRALFASENPGKMTFGPTDHFAGENADVVYASVKSPDLERLNAAVKDGVKTTDTQPKYIPHATVAYVKPGRGPEFSGMTSLEGTDAFFSSVHFSDTDGNMTEIPIGIPSLRAAAERKDSFALFANGSERDASDDALAAVLRILRGDDQLLKDLARQYHVAGFELGEQQIADLLGIANIVPIQNQRVIDFLDTKANQIVSVNETTANRIMATIREMVGAGDSPEDIGQAIRDIYNLRDAQSTLIARQEVGSSLSGGRFLLMNDEGVRQHEWLSSRDDRVRDDHKKEDGNIVAIGEPFPVTRLVYPQDPDGDPSEVINCRCITLPVGEDRGGMLNRMDRSAYWRMAADRSTRRLSRAMSDKLQKYFNTQRGHVLRVLAELGVSK